MGLFKKLFGSKDAEKQDVEPKAESPMDAFDKVPWMTDLRRQNVSICLEAGFRPTTSLPTELGRQLRPTIEIANRLHVIKALVLWLMVPQDHLPDDVILKFIDQNGLRVLMSVDEKSILSASRDDEDFRNAIGWKFENAWPLAWYFGYSEPDIGGQMMSGNQMQEILQNYTCGLDGSIEEWTKNREVLSEAELAQKEDLFYCLHNAVRSAQMGGTTVPSTFDPVGNGGVIHERRHSLTWMLSKGVSWEETDLST